MAQCNTIFDRLSTRDGIPASVENPFPVAAGGTGMLYNIRDIDDNANPEYYGFITTKGKWYILRIEEVSGLKEFRYHKPEIGTPYDFSQRASLTYEPYEIAFQLVFPQVTISTPVPLTKSNLNGGVIELELTNDVFEDTSLNLINFKLENIPVGVSVSQVNYIDKYNAEIILGYDGTPFSLDYSNVHVNVCPNELLDSIDRLYSNVITITA